MVFYSCRARSIIYGAHRFILNERDVLLSAGEYETAFLMSIEPMKLPEHPFLAGRSGDFQNKHIGNSIFKYWYQIRPPALLMGGPLYPFGNPVITLK